MALTKISTGMLKQDAASSDLNIDAGTLYLDVSNNRVGIGNTSPWDSFVVYGGGVNFGSAPNSGNTAKLTYDSTNGHLDVNAYSTGGNTNIRFFTSASGTNTEAMRIDASGDVAIGTAGGNGRALEVLTSNDYVAKFESSDSTAAIIIEDNGSTNNGNRIGVVGDTMSFAIANSSLLNLTGSEVQIINRAHPELALIPSGSVGNADIRFDGTSLDIRSNSSSAYLTLQTSTTERFRIDSNGDIRFNNSAGNAKFFWDASTTRLGIGTTTPNSTLHIDTVSEFPAITLARSTTNPGLSFTVGMSDFEGGGTDLLFDGVGSSTGFGFRPRNSSGTQINGLVIAPSGNVGIGTSSPQAKVHVDGDGNYITVRGYSQVLDLGNWTDGEVRIESTGAPFHIRAAGNQPLHLETNNVERLSISGTGNVGIGDTTPNYKLDITAAGNGINITGAGAYLRWNAGDIQIKNEGSYKMGFYTYSSGNSTLNRRMVLDTNGNLGIGVDAPSYDLDIAGHMRVSKTTSTGYSATSFNSAPTVMIRHTAGDTLYGAIRFTNTSGNYEHFIGAVQTASDQADIVFQGYDRTASGYKEYVRLSDSGNLGVGINNPDAYGRMVVSGTGNIFSVRADSGASRIGLFEGGSGRFYIDSLNGSDGIAFVDANGTSERMRIDAAGAIGVGTTPPTTNSHPQIFIGTESVILGSSSGALDIGNNMYYNSGWKYRSAGLGSLLDFDSGGNIVFYRAPSGSADAAVTLNETMRLQSNGTVRIGTRSPQTGAKLHLRRNGANIEFGHENTSYGYYGTLGAFYNGGNPYLAFSAEANTSGNTFNTHGHKGNVIYSNTSGDLIFGQVTVANQSGQSVSDRMRLDNGGRLGIGIAPTTSNDMDKVILQFPSSFAIGGAYSSFGETQSGQSTIIGNNIIAVQGVNNRVMRHRSSGDPGNFLKLTYNEGFTIHTGVTSTKGSEVSPTGLNERVRVDTSGNVGIGTNSPAEKLHVEGSVLIDAFNLGDEEGIFFREGFSSTNKYNVSIMAKDHNGSSADGISINGYDGVSFCTGSNSRNEVMRIVGGSGSDVGYVGIGTQDPNSKLQVHGADAQIRISGDNSMSFHQDSAWNSNIYFGAQYNGSNVVYGASGRGAFRMVNLHDGDSSPQYIAFYGANAGTAGNAVSWNTVGFAQDEDGNVGIGTTSPSCKLNVLAGNGTANGNVAFKIGGPSNYNSLEMGIGPDTYAGFMRSYGNDLHYYSGHFRTVGSTASENHQHYWYTSKSGSTNWSDAKMKLDEYGDLYVGHGVNKARLKTNGTSTFLDAIPASSDIVFRNNGSVEALRIKDSGAIHHKEQGNNGDYTSYIGSLCPGNNGNRYIHVQLSTGAGEMFWVEVIGYDYLLGDEIYGRAGGYVYLYNTQTNVYADFYNGDIVAMYQNTSAYVEIVIDTQHTGTSNRWGSQVLRGGTDTITSSQPLEIIQYSYTSTTTKVY